MPNWVRNHIYIEGTAEEIAKMKQQLGQATEKPGWEPIRRKDGTYVADADGNLARNNITHREEEPIFSFWNVVRPGADEYERYRNDGWYDWNCTHWGTKWDASEVESHDDLTKGEWWNVSFSTAWAPPHEMLIALSAQYPEVSIRNEWSEEQGYGGHYDYMGGSFVVDKEWNIPESHQESMDNLGYCYCEYGGVFEMPFSDCIPTKDAVAELELANEMV